MLGEEKGTERRDRADTELTGPGAGRGADSGMGGRARRPELGRLWGNAAASGAQLRGPLSKGQHQFAAPGGPRGSSYTHLFAEAFGVGTYTVPF